MNPHYPTTIIKKNPWILLILLLIACNKEQESSSGFKVDVPFVQPQQKDVPIYREFVGQIYGESDIEIRSRVDGWITSLAFKEGGL